MSRKLNIRLDAALREYRGALARHEVDVRPDGTPGPIVRNGRLYEYSHDETTREGSYLWAVFADRGPVAAAA